MEGWRIVTGHKTKNSMVENANQLNNFLNQFDQSLSPYLSTSDASSPPPHTPTPLFASLQTRSEVNWGSSVIRRQQAQIICLCSTARLQPQSSTSESAHTLENFLHCSCSKKNRPSEVNDYNQRRSHLIWGRHLSDCFSNSSDLRCSTLGQRLVCRKCHPLPPTSDPLLHLDKGSCTVRILDWIFWTSLAPLTQFSPLCYKKTRQHKNCSATLLPATLWMWVVDHTHHRMTGLNECTYITLWTQQMDCLAQNSYSKGRLNTTFIYRCRHFGQDVLIQLCCKSTTDCVTCVCK